MGFSLKGECEGNIDDKATIRDIQRLGADKGQYPTGAVGILSL